MKNPGDGWPSATYAWYVVAVLAIANAVSFIDRLILSLLVPAMKADLGLTDTRISLLQGFAFALFYTLMGLPLARWADARSRKWLITLGVLFWSLMTATCGLARNFWQLFAARVGVGSGEATLSPPPTPCWRTTSRRTNWLCRWALSQPVLPPAWAWL